MKIKILLINLALVCASCSSVPHLTQSQQDALVSGALGQVYTLENAAIPFTSKAVSDVIGRIISDPTLQASLTNQVVATVQSEIAAGSPLNAAINKALTSLASKV